MAHGFNPHKAKRGLLIMRNSLPSFRVKCIVPQGKEGRVKDRRLVDRLISPPNATNSAEATMLRGGTMRELLARSTPGEKVQQIAHEVGDDRNTIKLWSGSTAC